MKVRSRRLALVAVVLLLLVGGVAGDAPEYDLKAAFVYNFAKFVEWPPGSFPPGSESLVLGILAQDPERPAFEALAGKMVQGRLVVVKPCTLADLKNSHLIFVSAAASRYTAAALEAVRQLPVLSVTDEVEGKGPRGIINFLTTGGKVRFQVNMRQARQVGLKISSHLLRLAESVEN